MIHLKSKGGDIERYDEILDLLITLNRDYSDKEIIIMGDFNGEKDTFEKLFTDQDFINSYIEEMKNKK